MLSLQGGVPLVDVKEAVKAWSSVLMTAIKKADRGAEGAALRGGMAPPQRSAEEAADIAARLMSGARSPFHSLACSHPRCHSHFTLICPEARAASRLSRLQPQSLSIDPLTTSLPTNHRTRFWI